MMGLILCPLCGFDNTFIVAFFALYLGAITLGTVFFLFWAIGRGHFKDTEAPKYRVLEMEAEGEEVG
jgi:nitrogen fixation-related uncharacterized protein